MFRVVVFYIPTKKLSFQVRKGLEFVLIVEFFLVGAVAAFHGAVLGRFARIDQVMGDAMFGAEHVQRVQNFYRPVASFIGTNRPIREVGVVIGLYGFDRVREGFDHPFQKH